MGWQQNRERKNASPSLHNVNMGKEECDRFSLTGLYQFFIYVVIPNTGCKLKYQLKSESLTNFQVIGILPSSTLTFRGFSVTPFIISRTQTKLEIFDPAQMLERPIK